MKCKFGIEVDTGQDMAFDLDILKSTRLLIQANSGGGKSYAIRKLLESWFGHIQIIVLDLEGEFGTLREKFEFILAGKDGDFPTDVRTAERLARKTLELGFSIIIDLYELKDSERHLYVKNFLDALINSPKNLWHPCIVVVDEAHHFAPEHGQGESIALGSVIDLMSRGRKRGFCGVIATQRLSKLNKNAAAMAVNKLIGLCSIPLDQKQAAFELGFKGQDETLALRDLEPGEFYAFGRAVSKEVVKVKIGKVSTTHYEAGEKIPPPPPPTDKTRAVLSKLSDIPQEAQKDEDEKEHLKVVVGQMRVKIRELEQRNGKVSPEQLQTMYKKGLEDGKRLSGPILFEMKAYDVKKQAYVKEASGLLNKILELKPPVIPEPKISIPMTWGEPKVGAIDGSLPPLSQKISARIHEYKKLNGQTIITGALRMLKAVAQFDPRPITLNQMGLLAGFTASGGTFKNYLGDLKRGGYIEVNGDEVKITEMGLETVGGVEPLSTDTRQLLEMWVSKLTTGAGKMLKVIVEKYPSAITQEELGVESGFTASGGTFKNYLGDLKRAGLIESEGTQSVKASKELFPMENF